MRNRQLGLVEGPMLYGMAALGVALLVASGWALILSARLDGCRESLDAANAKIELQNAAVGRLKVDGDERSRKAEAAAKAADAKSLDSAREAARLRSEATKAREPQQPNQAGTCKPSLADRATSKIREGL